MRRAVLFSSALVLSTACSTSFQQVEIAQPTGAHVVIEGGLGQPTLETTTPFIGNFETVSLSDWAAYHLTFQLDAKAAARYGASGPLTLYGHLFVGPQTELSKRLTLIVKVPDELIAALVQGRRVEIEEHVEDPNPQLTQRLAQLTLRLVPF